jgi:hypothetical protein
MGHVVRGLIVGLVVAVGVSSTGIPIISPSPPSAAAQEASQNCPPDSEDETIPGGVRTECIAEEWRTSRAAYVRPVCLDTRALLPGTEYHQTECAGGGNTNWIEAIAHAQRDARG